MQQHHQPNLIKLRRLAQLPETPDYPVFKFLANYHRLLLTRQIDQNRK